MEDRVMKKNKLFFLLAFLVLLVSGIKAKAETLTGQAHMQNSGWQTSQTVNENQILNLGIVDTTLRVEAMKISVTGPVSGGINYQAQSQSLGWQPAVSDGQIAGTVGKSLRMETIKVSLTGDLATSYDIYYRTQVENYGWLGWTKDGNPSGTVSKSLRLQALQLVLVKKGSTLPITVDTSKNPCISPDDPLQTYRMISSTNVYNSGTDARNYQYFAIKESNRSDGLYSAPYATDNTADIANQKAKNYDKTVVYADKAVVLSNGSNFTHINLNGSWYWVDSDALSWEQVLPYASHPILTYNSYNSNGQIVYYSNSKFSTQLDEAANYWNQVLGTTVFVKTTNSLATNMTLKVSDVTNGTTGDSSYLMGAYGNYGLMFVNLSFIGKDQGNFNYTSSSVIKNIFIHELGHTLGLDHTGDSNSDSNSNLLPGSVGWSWSDKSDIMWATNISGDSSSQTVLTAQDIAAAKLVRNLKMFYSTANPLNYEKIISKDVTNSSSNQFEVLYPRK